MEILIVYHTTAHVATCFYETKPSYALAYCCSLTAQSGQIPVTFDFTEFCVIKHMIVCIQGCLHSFFSLKLH